MVSMSPTVVLESKMQGGIGKALGRMFGGESLFQTTFTATHGPGEVLLAPAAIGDIMPIELQNQAIMVTSGCFLAADTSLQMETKLSGRAFFSGEGMFLMRFFGTGSLILSSFGAIHQVEIPAGMTYTVDTGHIVAFSEGMGYNVRTATKSLFGSFTSGEGFVADITGPGRLLIQTRAPHAFGPWLSSFIPRSG